MTGGTIVTGAAVTGGMVEDCGVVGLVTAPEGACSPDGAFGRASPLWLLERHPVATVIKASTARTTAVDLCLTGRPSPILE
jgi:hypothetical protein